MKGNNESFLKPITEFISTIVCKIKSIRPKK